MPAIRLQYLFDPLCGWCYASAPALSALAREFPQWLEMRPSGLFAGAGARELTPEWGDYAWANDQRIAAMTGQVFSQAYRQQVLLGGTARFDSGPMNRVLTAVQAIAPALEPGLLHRLQAARYVDGLDTGADIVVAQITAAHLQENGHAANADDLASQLQSDAALAQQTRHRLEENQSLMNQLGIRGVPQLLVRVDEAILPLNNGALYQGPEQLVAELRRLLA